MAEMKSKMNCWEYKKCGREPNGNHVHDLGVCPASLEIRLDGEHGGTNAGRACWVVAGTLCKGDIQGTFAQKFNNCVQCGFYNLVIKEEHPRFTPSTILLSKIWK